MTNENFRRELGHVFDEMTGSPTAALPDRVRSSLANVPEQRAPFWIAGVAAAVIAAMVVGIVVVGNFKRPQTKVLPVGVLTPSLSPAPEPSPPNFDPRLWMRIEQHRSELSSSGGCIRERHSDGHARRLRPRDH
jgi:hypothetical protein